MDKFESHESFLKRQELVKYVRSLPPEEAKKEALRIMEEYKAMYIKELEKQIKLYNKEVK